MNKTTKTILVGVATGLVASWIKGKLEPPLQKLGEEKFPPSPEALELKGADVTHRPENMPPAVLANRINMAINQRELSSSEKIKYMVYIHYVLGALIGVSYVAFINRNKKLSQDQGIAAGLVVWVLTHGSTVPALGLQAEVKKMPKSWWVWELGSHVFFGIALEQCRKVFNKIMN